MFEFFEPVLNSLCTEGWPWTSDFSASLKMLELKEYTTTPILCRAGAGTQDFVVHAKQALYLLSDLPLTVLIFP